MFASHCGRHSQTSIVIKFYLSYDIYRMFLIWQYYPYEFVFLVNGMRPRGRSPITRTLVCQSEGSGFESSGWSFCLFFHGFIVTPGQYQGGTLKPNPYRLLSHITSCPLSRSEPKMSKERAYLEYHVSIFLKWLFHKTSKLITT